MYFPLKTYQNHQKYRLSIVSILFISLAVTVTVSPPAQASIIAFQLNFNVLSGSTTLGGKTVDSGTPFIGTFSFDSDNLVQPITTVAQNQFSMNFILDGMNFNATNTLDTLEIQKLFSTQPDEITRLRNGIVTLDSNPSDFISFSNTGSPPSFLVGNGSTNANGNYTITSLGAVPLPAALLLFMSGLPGILFLKRQSINQLSTTNNQLA